MGWLTWFVFVGFLGIVIGSHAVIRNNTERALYCLPSFCNGNILQKCDQQYHKQERISALIKSSDLTLIARVALT